MVKRVNASPPSAGLCAAEECMPLLRALSDETRQKIIALFFKNRELCVGDIAAHFRLSRPAISHHLNLMKRAGLLDARKEGKEVYYFFNRAYVMNLMEQILDGLKRCC